MKPIFNPTIGAYYSNRAFEIAKAVKYLADYRMINAYDEMHYGQSNSGHFIIHHTGFGGHANTMFTDNHIEIYRANGSGILTTTCGYILKYADLDKLEDSRAFVFNILEFVLKAEHSDAMIDLRDDPASCSFNREWHAYLNHNIEQVADCVRYLTDANMGLGQAFYGCNSLGRLILWVKNNPTIKGLSDEDSDKSVVVEFQGDGIAVVYNADEFGMPKDNYQNGLIDDHWDSVRCGKQHSYFIDKVKKECGVHLL